MAGSSGGFVSFGGGIVPGAGGSEALRGKQGKSARQKSSVKVQSSSVISEKIGDNWGKWGVVPSKMKPK